MCGSSSSMRCRQEGHHLQCVAAKRVLIFNALQPRGSSSPMRCCKEGLHLQCVAAKRIIIFCNVLQLRGSSSSSMCCSQEDHHLFSCIAFHLLSCVAVKRAKIILIFSHELQPRGSSFLSFSICCSREDHHLRLLPCVAIERISLP